MECHHHWKNCKCAGVSWYYSHYSNCLHSTVIQLQYMTNCKRTYPFVNVLAENLTPRSTCSADASRKPIQVIIHVFRISKHSPPSTHAHTQHIICPRVQMLVSHSERWPLEMQRISPKVTSPMWHPKRKRDTNLLST